MHELGVVFYVIKHIEEVAQNENVSHINSVTLQIGEVSTVIPDLLNDCWKWAIKEHEILTDCNLKIIKIPAITHCENCGTDYQTVKYAKICPNCKSDNTYLLQGNEFNILEMEAV